MQIRNTNYTYIILNDTLPTQGPNHLKFGDLAYVIDTQESYFWNGSQWMSHPFGGGVQADPPAPYPQTLQSVEVGVSDIFISKAECVEAAGLLTEFYWEEENSFLVKDTQGVVRPTYLVHYYPNGDTDESGTAYRFYATLMMKTH